jgi:cell division septum initiation protein DivIVA
MKRKSDPISKRTHRKIAADLFNYTWSLLDRKRRTQAESDEMVHAAHASRYHWGCTGTALNRSVGEWQISRVYAVLGRPEPATFHARRSLEIAKRNRLGRFYLAYSYEAMARAAAVAGKRRDRDRYLREARRIGSTVRSSDDRRMLLEDLSTTR